jgi:hypothetical protein
MELTIGSKRGDIQSYLYIRKERSRETFGAILTYRRKVERVVELIIGAKQKELQSYLYTGGMGKGHVKHWNGRKELRIGAKQVDLRSYLSIKWRWKGRRSWMEMERTTGRTSRPHPPLRPPLTPGSYF